jgi:hypothetical protein
MEEVDEFYRRLLHYGLLVLRQAIYEQDSAWAKLEIELLHNLPSLISEPNIERHRYFWFVERDLYLEKIAALGIEKATSRMKTYYEPILNEMEPVMLRILRSADESNGSERLTTPQIANPPAASTSPAR